MKFIYTLAWFLMVLNFLSGNLSSREETTKIVDVLKSIFWLGIIFLLRSFQAV